MKGIGNYGRADPLTRSTPTGTRWRSTIRTAAISPHSAKAPRTTAATGSHPTRGRPLPGGPAAWNALARPAPRHR